MLTAALTSVLLGTLLSVTGPPAAHAAGTTVVRGHSYDLGADFTPANTGLTYWESACNDPLVRNPNRYYAVYRRGGAAETSQAIGFGPRNAKTGGEVGLLALIDDPRSLDYLNASVDAGAVGEGHVQAYLRGNGGWYVGSHGLLADVDGWGEWANLADLQLGWYFIYDNGEIDVLESGEPWVAAGTISQLANANSDVTFGRAGVFFGCAGEEYVVDNIRVGTASGLTTYDLEGVGRAPAYTLAWNTKKKRWSPGKGQQLEYGESVSLAGIAIPRTPDLYYLDSGRLLAKAYGDKKWRPVGKASLFDDETTSKPAKVRPYRRTSYRFVTGGYAGDPSVSKPYVVDVRAKVKARAEQGKVRQGDRIPVSGKYQPRNKGIKMTLERKVGKKWRTVAKGRTNGAGGFSFRAKATSVGKWVLRVVAASGKGNLGNRTGSFSVQVVPKPPPPTNPCGSACDGDTPDPIDYNPPTYEAPDNSDDLPDVFRLARSGGPADAGSCTADAPGACPVQRPGASGGPTPADLARLLGDDAMAPVAQVGS